ncbi:hypothetical protein DEO72_LG7g3012 [Vigna unguiculata]|uniref:Uncharacterized protein n=1 Tax=Vigna unguiculata TaxID=3917 RepID=A0A4D6MJZ0_VIGUN|nr:hypothetical protein DEO72_LG7g3012 [Vigna unguiculata]
MKSIPGHYVIYWELLMKDSRHAPSGDVLFDDGGVTENEVVSCEDDFNLRFLETV